MKVLVIGGGGREHALIWKLKQSPKIKKIFCAPGNAGISELATCVVISPTDLKGLLKFAKKEKMDLTIVGPELPLSLGIVDLFETHGLRIFGPSKEASQFESSKAFSKNFLERYSIPTAKYKVFEDSQAAKMALSEFKFPAVIKADGLAEGKGVSICSTSEEAVKAISNIMEKKVFGASGRKVVIEEFLKGEELSYMVLMDGEHFLPLASSQDHKALYDDDKGPNTGGMGAFSPATLLTQRLQKKITEQVIKPFLAGLQKEKIIYKGVLYIGLMVVDENPYVLEFNVRFGDPETQILMMRLKTDLVQLFEASISGSLDRCRVQWKKEAALCVVMTSEGYPATYEKGFVISGVSDIDRKNIVFHSGTRWEEAKLVTNGGRVLCVTSCGKTLKEARQRAYQGVSRIKWQGVYFRRDIGMRGIA